MKPIPVTIRQMGNSPSVAIPKPVDPARSGWADAAGEIAEAGDDALVMGEFGNAADADLAW